jgi:hypothetical protein
MNDWFRRQIETGWADLKGLNIKATVPLRDSVINNAIAEFLGASAAPRSAGPDLRGLLPLVKHAQVRTTEGAVVIDVEISV